MKITIGGLAGVGTSTIAQLLANKLGYEHLSAGNMFRAEAESRGLTMEEFDTLMLNNPSERVDDAIDARQKKYGQDHSVFVFESRLAWYFIPDSFKVKLKCDLDERIRRITTSDINERHAYEAADFAKTKEKTLKREAEHQKKISEIYGIDDLAADEHFDFVIDTTSMSPEEIANTIVIEAKQFFD